jgi:Zn-dependent protease with chaperone function
VLLTFLISLLVLYVPASDSATGMTAGWTLAGVGGMILLNALACWVGSRSAIRLSRRRTAKGRMRAVRVFKLLRVGVIGFVVLDVFLFGWPQFVSRTFSSLPRVPLLADLVLLFPVLVMLLTAATFRYHFISSRRSPALSLGNYLALRFRTELGILVLPWLLLAGVSDITVWLWGHSPHFLWIDVAMSLGLMGGIVIFAGPLLGLVWETSSLPNGSLRERLDRFCRDQGFRCRDIRIWHTYQHLPNAAVIGPVPWLRHVLLTDALLAHCSEEEIEGIFAHEVGHIKRHHLGFYIFFAISFTCFYANGVDLLARLGWVEPLSVLFSQHLTEGQALLMMVFAGLYWALVFGFLSRRLELEADLYSLRKASNPGAFISALRKLASLSGTPMAAGSWRHFSIARRTGFLRECQEKPELEKKTMRRIRLVQGAIVVLFLAAALRLAFLLPGNI